MTPPLRLTVTPVLIVRDVCISAVTNHRASRKPLLHPWNAIELCTFATPPADVLSSPSRWRMRKRRAASMFMICYWNWLESRRHHRALLTPLDTGYSPTMPLSLFPEEAGEETLELSQQMSLQFCSGQDPTRRGELSAADATDEMGWNVEPLEVRIETWNPINSTLQCSRLNF